LSEYFNEIFYKDFVERHKIKSIEFGRFLFEFSFQNFSKEISLRKIKSFFGRNISEKTLYDYVEKLQDTLAVFLVDKYSKSIYIRKSWPRRIYVCDLGISKVLGFSEDIKKRWKIAFI
jgi:predicted AAA+ superfamily ATPase